MPTYRTYRFGDGRQAPVNVDLPPVQPRNTYNAEFEAKHAEERRQSAESLRAIADRLAAERDAERQARLELQRMRYQHTEAVMTIAAQYERNVDETTAAAQAKINDDIESGKGGGLFGWW